MERTQPGPPLSRGPISTRTHDYQRYGTICLSAALSYLEGKLIERIERRHTHLGWLRLLKQIQRVVPKGLLAAEMQYQHAQQELGGHLLAQALQCPVSAARSCQLFGRNDNGNSQSSWVPTRTTSALLMYPTIRPSQQNNLGLRRERTTSE